MEQGDMCSQSRVNPSCRFTNQPQALSISGLENSWDKDYNRSSKPPRNLRMEVCIPKCFISCRQTSGLWPSLYNYIWPRCYVKWIRRFQIKTNDWNRGIFSFFLQRGFYLTSHYEARVLVHRVCGLISQ